jgi:signal transduction histidine kinase
LQGKLIACFMALLLSGLAGSCWLFLRQAHSIYGLLTDCAEIDAAMRRAEIAIITCNAFAAVLAVPVVMLLVFRIFEPIRQLASATDRIAAGDSSVRVAIHRPDAIGALARSFNKMVRRVREQQQDLAMANQRLAAANLDLEEKVRQRTVQLETANKRLKFEIAEKEDFLRAISHDLSAPLRNISGMAAMLLHKKRDVFDQEVIHRLERIQKNVEVETGLISELLELSKIKTGRQRIAQVDLNPLVREVAGVFEGDLQSRGIRFVVETQLPVLRCERPRMRQVFANLIDNAIKYMGDGTPSCVDRQPMKEIRVGATVRDDEVELYVQDTGMGIDDDDRETIFYVFRRGRSAAVRAIAGKGVGLACVKSIVETYNGSIWVESSVGQGSTFRFTINGKYLSRSRELAGAT